MKQRITIEPDYDVFLWWNGKEDASGSLDDLYDKRGGPISLPEIIEWALEIKPIVIASETGESYEKDWADFHQRGLELAHKLRLMLSDDFELWYSAPFEDKSGTIPKPILICSKESKSLKL